MEPKTFYFNFVWLLQNRFLLSISRKLKLIIIITIVIIIIIIIIIIMKWKTI